MSTEGLCQHQALLGGYFTSSRKPPRLLPWSPGPPLPQPSLRDGTLPPARLLPEGMAGPQSHERARPACLAIFHLREPPQGPEPPLLPWGTVSPWTISRTGPWHPFGPSHSLPQMLMTPQSCPLGLP